MSLEKIMYSLKKGNFVRISKWVMRVFCRDQIKQSRGRLIFKDFVKKAELSVPASMLQ